MRLKGRWGVMVFNFQTWQRIIALARNYGWQPGITKPDYYLTIGRIMNEADAFGLAAALERVLPDIPDHQAIATATESSPAISELRRVSQGITMLEWFSGETKRNLENFIIFCRTGGSFEIG